MIKKYFELLNISNDKETTYEALGISEERQELLEKEIVYELHQDKRVKFSENLAYLVNKCESLEEVAWICFSFGCQVGAHQLPSNFHDFLNVVLLKLKNKIEGNNNK